MARRLQSSNNQSDVDSTSPHVRVSTWGLRLRNGGFAELRLGSAGWLALLSPGVVLGLLVARLSSGSFIVWGTIGGVMIWLLAVAAERLSAGNRPTHFDAVPPLSAAELERVEEAARYAGIKFEHTESEAPSDAGSTVDNSEGVAQARSMFVTKTKYVARLQNIVAIKREPHAE